MAVTTSSLRARTVGERLWAALLFLCIPVYPLAILLGVVTYLVTYRRRPFPASAGLQAAMWALLTLLVILGANIAIVYRLGGALELNNIWGLTLSKLRHEPVTIFMNQRPFIALFIGLCYLDVLVAALGMLLALAGILLPLPFPPALLRRWVAQSPPLPVKKQTVRPTRNAKSRAK